MASEDLGASSGPGSRPTDHAPSGHGAPRFDPSRMDDTDWHVLAQDISHHWSHPEEVAVAYQAAAEALKLCRAEMERRDRNEIRNCLNWGPCSRHDGHMRDESQ